MQTNMTIDEYLNDDFTKKCIGFMVFRIMKREKKENYFKWGYSRERHLECLMGHPGLSKYVDSKNQIKLKCYKKRIKTMKDKMMENIGVTQ